jgi:MoxR-like ATPase
MEHVVYSVVCQGRSVHTFRCRGVWATVASADRESSMTHPTVAAWPQAPTNPASLAAALREHAYLPDHGLATALHVALCLGRPVLLEGDAGVGKTEASRALASTLGARLIRLQCYEGLDVAHAMYDWNYARQMLYTRVLEDARLSATDRVDELFGPRFLLRRPLLDAIDNDDPVPPVLLVDEIDRADDEFEAFLLELLADFQVTIPELGTIRAAARPFVMLTSNRTRELHDALRRRCLYYWLGPPSREREIAIIKAHVPEVSDRLAAQSALFVGRLRAMELLKPPGLAETLDWVRALLALGQAESAAADQADAILGAVLKHEEDLRLVREAGLDKLLVEGGHVEHA